MGILKQEEVRNILTFLKETYPNSFTNHTAVGSQMMLQLWCETFKNEDAKLVQAAVFKAIQENRTSFVPPLGVIRDYMKEIAGIRPQDADEAWVQVRRIWSNLSSDNPSEIKAEYESLPKAVKRIYTPADLVELAFHTTSHDIEAFEKPRFMNAYKSIAVDEIDRQLEHKSITALAIETKGRLMIE